MCTQTNLYVPEIWISADKIFWGSPPMSDITCNKLLNRSQEVVYMGDIWTRHWQEHNKKRYLLICGQNVYFFPKSPIKMHLLFQSPKKGIWGMKKTSLNKRENGLYVPGWTRQEFSFNQGNEVQQGGAAVELHLKGLSQTKVRHEVRSETGPFSSQELSLHPLHPSLMPVSPLAKLRHEIKRFLLQSSLPSHVLLANAMCCDTATCRPESFLWEFSSPLPFVEVQQSICSSEKDGMNLHTSLRSVLTFESSLHQLFPEEKHNYKYIKVMLWESKAVDKLFSQCARLAKVFTFCT